MTDVPVFHDSELHECQASLQVTGWCCCCPCKLHGLCLLLCMETT